MSKRLKELISEANARVVNYSPAQAMTLLNDKDVLFVDVRDLPELEQDGKIPGAIHASRGMLEFLVDPASPYHNPLFAAQKHFVIYCASGGRSALAAQRMQEMGVASVAHMSGGLRGWKEMDGPVEKLPAVKS